MKNCVFTCLLIFSFFLEGQAQKTFSLNNNLVFESIDSKDGLQHNTVNTVFQDYKGYMWIGAYNALYRYDGYNFKRYKNDSNNNPFLRENHITTIYEDHSHVLWIGTKQGLYHYNRNSDTFSLEIFTNKKNGNAITNTRINAIFQDRNQNLWIGTSSGLYQLSKDEKEPKAYQIKRFDIIKNNFAVGSNIVNAICEDSLGNIWFGTTSGLFYTRNTKSEFLLKGYQNLLSDKKILTNQFITSLLTDKSNNLWVGTSSGLNKLSLNASAKFYRLEKFTHDVTDNKSLTDNKITSLCEDQEGTLWIGTQNNGISLYNKYSNSFKNYIRNDLKESSINSNYVNSIFKSKRGVIWIGYNGGALNKVDPFKKHFYNYHHIPREPTSLSDNLINCIYEDSDNNLWVGTNTGGLNKSRLKNPFEFQKYNATAKKNEKLLGDNILSICEDNFKNLWVATDKGVHLIDKSLTKDIKRFQETSFKYQLNNVSTIFKDHLGDLWLGAYNGDGLSKLTPTKFGLQPLNITKIKIKTPNEDNSGINNIAVIFEDSNHLLWIGTYGGGIIRIKRNQKNEPISYNFIRNNAKDPHSLSSDNVFAFDEDTAGNIWIATFGGGLNKIDKQERYKENPKFIVYGEKQGLLSDELYGILKDENGNLWISTNNGIFSFNLKSQVFSNFRTDDGIQASNFRRQAYFKGQNGRLYFGGINGFNVFNPNEFKNRLLSRNVEIVDFKLFNESVLINQKILGKIILTKPINETKKLILNQDHNSFSFEFSALNYSSQNQTKYAYMLEGFDKDWIYTTSRKRFASYSSLDDGFYTLKIKASNSDNTWSNNIKTLQIRVLPALYETWWAYSIYTLIILSLLFWYRKIILIKEGFRNKLHIEHIEQEKIKELSELKLEFFTNISHEFKTPLTLILGPIEKILKEESTSIKTKESLTLVNRSAKHLHRLITELLEFRSLKSSTLTLKRTPGDFVEFCEGIIGDFKPMGSSKNIEITFKSNVPVYRCDYDWSKLEKILYNLISNAIKYTPTNKTVKIILSVNQKVYENNDHSHPNISIQVIDSGNGIPQSELDLIFEEFYISNVSEKSNSDSSGIGLSYTKKLVELLQGTINVISSEGLGSEFTVSLPIKDQFSIGEIIDNYKLILPSENSQTFINEANEELGDEKLTLLIVEDNIDMQIFLKNTFSAQYRILQAFDGEEGFKLAQDELPDIIISDVMMPKKGGIQLCTEIKTNYITNHIPVILLTSKSTVENQIEGLDVGADAYIPKPFEVDYLNSRLKNLIKQRELLKSKFSGDVPVLDSMKKGLNKSHKEFLEKAEQMIQKNLVNAQFGVDQLANEMALSPMQLYRKFKSVRGYSTNEFIREYRLKIAAQLLLETDLNITQILYEVGYVNRSYFTKCFKEQFKMTPKEFANKHQVKYNDSDSTNLHE